MPYLLSYLELEGGGGAPSLRVPCMRWSLDELWTRLGEGSLNLPGSAFPIPCKKLLPREMERKSG